MILIQRDHFLQLNLIPKVAGAGSSVWFWRLVLIIPDKAREISVDMLSMRERVRPGRPPTNSGGPPFPGLSPLDYLRSVAKPYQLTTRSKSHGNLPDFPSFNRKIFTPFSVLLLLTNEKKSTEVLDLK